MRKWYYAAATIMGAIIGAGVLGIPFAFAKAGLVYGLINLALVAVVFLFVNLYLGEVMLRTRGIHQLSGYAEKYLGRKGKAVMSLALIFAIYGALIAYLIGLGEVTSSLLGGQPFFYTTVFFVAFSGMVYAGIKAISRSEFIFSTAKFLIFIALIISLAAFFRPGRIGISEFSVGTMFLPYGVVLFSFLGFPAIPEAREILAGEEKNLKKTLVVSTFIPAAVYALFAVFFAGSLGSNIGEVAVVTLGTIGRAQLVLGFAFAFLCMTTAYLSLALALQEVYEYDYGLRHSLSFVLTAAIPYLLILLGVKSFVGTLSIVGAVGGGVTGILIILMFLRAKKRGDRIPEYRIKKYDLLAWVLIALFAAGIAYEIIFIF